MATTLSPAETSPDDAFTEDEYLNALQCVGVPGTRNTTLEALTLSPSYAPDALDRASDADDPDFSDFPMEPRRENAFTICDEGSASWYLNKLAAIAEKRSRYTAQFQEIIQTLDDDENRLENRFGDELRLWAAEELEKQGKGKTVKLLAGSISFTHRGQSLKITNLEAALKEATEHFAGFVQMIPKLDTTAYRNNAVKVLETVGELLPGLEIVPEHESMSIKLGGKS